MMMDRRQQVLRWGPSPLVQQPFQNRGVNGLLEGGMRILRWLSDGGLDAESGNRLNNLGLTSSAGLTN